MTDAKERWNEVGSALDGLADKLRERAAQAAAEARESGGRSGSGDDVDSAVSDASRKARAAVDQGVQAVGDMWHDPAVRADMSRFGQTLGGALSATFDRLGQELRGARGQAHSAESRVPAAYVGDLDQEGSASDFRRVLFTGEHSQLVVMTLQPGEEIGEEVHDVDQSFVVLGGSGEAVIDGTVHPLATHTGFGVPAGARHNVVASGAEALRLLTVYAPAHHPAGTVHHTKAEADAAE